MIKRASLLAAVVAAGGVTLAVTQAGATTAVKPSVSQSGTMAVIATTSPCSQPPQKGKSQTFAGNLTGSPGGTGAMVLHTVFAGSFGPKGAPITGTVTFFEPEGSYGGSLSGTNTASGSSATVTISKGSGLYKGAHGTVTFTTKAPSCASGSPVITSFKVTGSMTS